MGRFGQEILANGELVANATTLCEVVDVFAVVAARPGQYIEVEVRHSDNAEQRQPPADFMPDYTQTAHSEAVTQPGRLPQARPLVQAPLRLERRPRLVRLYAALPQLMSKVVTVIATGALTPSAFARRLPNADLCASFYFVVRAPDGCSIVRMFWAERAGVPTAFSAAPVESEHAVLPWSEYARHEDQSPPLTERIARFELQISKSTTQSWLMLLTALTFLVGLLMRVHSKESSTEEVTPLVESFIVIVGVLAGGLGYLSNTVANRLARSLRRLLLVVATIAALTVVAAAFEEQWALGTLEISLSATSLFAFCCLFAVRHAPRFSLIESSASHARLNESAAATAQGWQYRQRRLAAAALALAGAISLSYVLFAFLIL